MSTLMSTYIHICYASRFIESGTIMDRIPKFRATVCIYVKRKWIRFLKEVLINNALNKRFGIKYTIDPGVFSTIFQWFTNYCQSVSALQNVCYQILHNHNVIQFRKKLS